MVESGKAACLEFAQCTCHFGGYLSDVIPWGETLLAAYFCREMDLYNDLFDARASVGSYCALCRI